MLATVISVAVLAAARTMMRRATRTAGTRRPAEPELAGPAAATWTTATVRASGATTDLNAPASIFGLSMPTATASPAVPVPVLVAPILTRCAPAGRHTGRGPRLRYLRPAQQLATEP